MRAYRDELEAAQQRIHQLEQEVEKLRRQTAREQPGPGANRQAGIVPVQLPPSGLRFHWSILLVAPVVVLAFSERFPPIYFVGAIFFFVFPLTKMLHRSRKARSGENELLLLMSNGRLEAWAGPQSELTVPEGKQAFLIRSQPGNVEVTLPAVALADGNTTEITVQADVRFAPEEALQDERAAQALQRGLLLLGDPPRLDALKTLLRDAVDEPLRQYAASARPDQLERLSRELSSSGSTTSKNLPPRLIETLEQVRDSYGVIFENLQLRMAHDEP